MSVITYIYPRDLNALAIEPLLAEIRKQVDYVTIGELELKKRSTPDWQAVVFCHPSEPEVEMLFVVSRNSKENIDDLGEQYRKMPEFSVVQSATIMIWSQLKWPHLPLKRFMKISAVYEEVLATVADVSDGVIDSPERERLFTPSTFRRYVRMYQRRFEHLGTSRR